MVSKKRDPKSAGSKAEVAPISEKTPSVGAPAKARTTKKTAPIEAGTASKKTPNAPKAPKAAAPAPAAPPSPPNEAAVVAVEPPPAAVDVAVKQPKAKKAKVSKAASEEPTSGAAPTREKPAKVPAKVTDRPSDQPTSLSTASPHVASAPAAAKPAHVGPTGTAKATAEIRPPVAAADAPAAPVSTAPTGFAALGLSPAVLSAIVEIGYEAPSPIQISAIPPLLAGRDLLGQAQTGTGKTAAFALPLLSRLDLSRRVPQFLVLTPTRELAIQVAEALSTYARKMPGFHVLPVYGGQAMAAQLRPLARGVHAIVGTPGRIIDHLHRGTLDLSQLSTVVLDEADEMLRMGFLDDVESILAETPKEAQVALFSATMPPAISRIARKRLVDPVEVRIESATRTVAAVNQFWWEAAGAHKLDALTRILEVGEFDAALVFVRTRISAVELSEKLEARGFACGSLHGDMTQPLREKTVERLRAGSLDIVVATDVAARGLDVERISHVINYDLPPDVESYVHRIGRTGRAGRGGEAILFVTPRERRLLDVIQRSTGQRIEKLRMPSFSDIVDRRVGKFKLELSEVLAGTDLEMFEQIISSYREETDASIESIAAAFAFLAQRERPLVPKLAKLPEPPVRRDFQDSRPERPQQRRERGGNEGGQWEPRGPVEWRAWRVAVGRAVGTLPANLVGAIANEIGIASRFIGRIDIQENYSMVELPADLPRAAIDHLAGVVVRGKTLDIEPFQGPPPSQRPGRPGGPRDRGDRPDGDRGGSPFRGKPRRY